MTIDDVNELLALAKVNYGYAFKSMSQSEKALLVECWAVALADVPTDIVAAAFMKLLATHKWLPTICEIREKIGAIYWETRRLDDGIRLMGGDSPRMAEVRAHILRETEKFCEGGTQEPSIERVWNGLFGPTIEAGTPGSTAIGEERNP